MRANSELPLLFFVFFLLFLCVLRVLFLAEAGRRSRFSRYSAHRSRRKVAPTGGGSVATQGRSYGRGIGRDARSLLRRRACGASYQLPLAPPPLLLPPPQLLELLELLELLKLLLLSEGGGRTGSTLRSV